MNDRQVHAARRRARFLEDAAANPSAPVAELAERHEYAIGSAYQMLSNAGLLRGRRRPPPRIAALLEDARANPDLTAAALAARHGLKQPVARYRLRRAGIRVKRPKRVVAAPLVERELAIIAAYRAGQRLREIGAAHGISGQRVSQIVVRYERRTGDVVKRRHRTVGRVRHAGP